MKKITILLIFSFLFTASVTSQPQYYNAMGTAGGNAFPFNVAAGKVIQWIYLSGEFSNPSPAPSGFITKVYFMLNTGSATYTDLTIKMGLDVITSLPTGVFYTGQLDTVYHHASANLTSTSGTFVGITLDVPFFYDNTKSLIIEVNQCTAVITGSMTIYNTTQSGIRRTFNQTAGGCNYIYQGQSGTMANTGIDIAAPPAVNRCLLFPTPGVNTNYVQIPFQSGMNGFTSITIEGWLKPGSTALANTVLNKGAASFDYQLGVNGATGNPFFRAGTTIIIASSVTISAGVWTHLAVTVGSGTIKFYKNGVMSFTQAASPTFGTSSNEMRIGRGNADPVSGNLDEIRLWNVARSDAEISADMCNKWVPNSATGLKGKWHFDSTYTDSVNGWNGTPLGTVSFDTVTWCPITGIQQTGIEVPSKYVLEQNYPNPFNPSTTITFAIPKEGYVEMKLYDVLGKEVAVLVSDPYRAGTYEVEFDASRLASGVYFYKITVGDFTATKKMVLLK